MVKLARAGRVKSRLAAGIGVVPALWWYRHQLRALLRRLRDPRWHLVLAVSPDHAGLTTREFPADLARLPQGGGDIGDRMLRALGACPGPVCLIGSDIPGVTRAHLARGFAALGDKDAVFGPSEDGGFWLVGLRRGCTPPQGLFRRVRWSSEHALADTLAGLKGARVALVDRLNDVDEAADLKRGRA